MVAIKKTVHTVWHCNMFLRPEDLEKVKMGSLLSLVANAGLDLVL